MLSQELEVGQTVGNVGIIWSGQGSELYSPGYVSFEVRPIESLAF